MWKVFCLVVVDKLMVIYDFWVWMCCFKFDARFRTSHWRCSIKKVFLKILQNWQAWGLQLYQKRDCDTDVSCEFCEIFKNTFLTEHLRATASNSSRVDRKSRSNYEFFYDSILNLLQLFIPATRWFEEVAIDFT